MPEPPPVPRKKSRTRIWLVLLLSVFPITAIVIAYHSIIAQNVLLLFLQDINFVQPK